MMNDKIGVFKISAVIFGSGVVIAAIVFFIILAYSLDHTPPAYLEHEKFAQQFQNYYFLTKEDFYLCLALSGVAGAFIWIFGIVYWIREGKSEDFKKDVAELYENKYIRFFGITLNGASIGGILYVILEYIFATPEYPAKYHEAHQFVIVFGFFTAIGYWIFALLKWIVRKITEVFKTS